MAVAYRQIMVNTADSPIMKIFDSFNRTGSPPLSKTRPAKTAGALSPTDHSSE
jgi:hypothetical protein